MVISDEHKNKAIHIVLELGENRIMGSDIIPDFGQKFFVGNNSYITLYPKNHKKDDKIFAKLSKMEKLKGKGTNNSLDILVEPHEENLSN